MIEPCFSQIQLIHNLIYKLSESKGLAMESKTLSPQLLSITLSNKDMSVSVRVMQISTIIKLQVGFRDLRDSLWFNCPNYLNKRLGNTYSLASIHDSKTLSRVMDRRVFKYLERAGEGNKLEVVLGVPLLVGSLLKYLRYREGEELMRVNKEVNGNLRSNSMYKGIYEARFGKTGFGLNLDWRKNYVKKIREKEGGL